MMRFGLLLDPSEVRGENYYDTILASAQAAEEASFDAVWLADHFQSQHQGSILRTVRRAVSIAHRTTILARLSGGLAALESWLVRQANVRAGRMIPVLECFTTLAAVASCTRRIRIGAFVAGAPYRNPALLAKLFTTLDIISHGRCIAGIGAGWDEAEFLAYGWPFPSVRERMERLEETVQIVCAMMRAPGGATYHGRHHQIAQALNYPPPIQHPHPPIMIGGSGERRTLRIVAKHADYCNVFGDPPTVARRLRVLADHCAAVGRSFDSIVRTNFVGVLLTDDTSRRRDRRSYQVTNGYPIIGTAQEVADQLRAFADIGIQYAVVHLPDLHHIKPIYRFAELVAPRLAD